MLSTLILSSILVLDTQAGAQPHRFRVLLVGAGKYPQFSNQDLSAAADVERIHDFFVERLDVAESQIRVVSDKSQSLDKQKILKEIREWLVQGARPGDIVVLWWGGHGIAVPTGSGSQTIGAIVPPKVAMLPSGEIDCDSLILTREIRVELGKLPRDVTDATLFLDCCFSGGADRSSGQSREIIAKVTKPDPKKMALPELGDPKDFVYVSAGNQFQPVSEVRTEDGLAIGPLAYSLIKLGPRIAAGLSYRDFGSLLNGVAMQTRSTREPEVRGAVDRPLFGGQVANQDWRFPVFFAKSDRGVNGQASTSTYRRRFKAFSAEISYDNDLPFIPVGQLQGIRPGMRFVLTNPQGFKQEFEAGLCFADFTQLKPTGKTTAPPAHDDYSARVVDSVGARIVKIGVADVATAQSLDWIRLMEQWNGRPGTGSTGSPRHPLVRLAAVGESADYLFRIDPNRNVMEISSRQGATVMLKPVDQLEKNVDELIEAVSHGDLVRNLELEGIPSYLIEARLVPVETNITPAQIRGGQSDGQSMRATKLDSGRSLSGRIGPDTVYAVAVRVRANPEAEKLDPDHIPGSFFAKHTQVFLTAITVDQNHQVDCVFPKRSAPAGDPFGTFAATPVRIVLDQWSPWTYLGLGGIPLPESEAVIAPAKLRLFYPNPAVGRGGTECIKVIANDKDFDFSRMEGSGARGDAGSAAEDLLNQIMNGEPAPESRGPIDRLQDWGVATVSYWLSNR